MCIRDSANGSQEAAEPGLSGIEITLRNNLSGAVFTTRSAGDGRFGFTDLPLTDYTLTVATVPGLHWNGPTTFAPVSYTHLDVYKRQAPSYQSL